MITRKTCSICHRELMLFRKHTCEVCGNVVCSNCCHKLNGVRAILHQFGNLPVTMCSRCKAIEKNRPRSPVPTEPVIHEVIGSEWYDSLRGSSILGVLWYSLVASIDLPLGERFTEINQSLVELDLPRISRLENYDISLSLNNGVVLTLSLETMGMSYEKDKWVPVFTPTDQRRLYLHIKYLYLAKNTRGNSHLFQTFRDYEVNADDYLHLYPMDLDQFSLPPTDVVSPVIPEFSPSPPITPRGEMTNDPSFMKYYVICFTVVLFCFCARMGGLGQLFRFVFSMVALSILFLTYPCN